ncbi:hypothetical protein [Steroidobacter cummioxidans]|uniref:hypothetical protein n=1 Tax=Steroidobacter cummioxidans TaxID=1803913 RepID=UPI000E320431|nr:hypothetical protein [Steroidobacter cummioxidans]
MTYTRNQARALCTAAEYQLFEASLDRKQHTLARLQSKIARTRQLRDKYRDLYKRQRIANRTRTGNRKGNRLDSNARTEQKAHLFDEVLKRFEQLAKQARALEHAPPKAKAAAKKKAKTRVAAKEPRLTKTHKAGISEGFVSEAALSADRRKHSRNTRSKTLTAHARAAGKRKQARRDSRG